MVNDVYIFDPATLTWEDISGAVKGKDLFGGSPATKILKMAMASAQNAIWVFGGINSLGEQLPPLPLHNPLIFYSQSDRQLVVCMCNQ